MVSLPCLGLGTVLVFPHSWIPPHTAPTLLPCLHVDVLLKLLNLCLTTSQNPHSQMLGSQHLASASSWWTILWVEALLHLFFVLIFHARSFILDALSILLKLTLPKWEIHLRENPFQPSGVPLTHSKSPLCFLSGTDSSCQPWGCPIHFAWVLTLYSEPHSFFRPRNGYLTYSTPTNGFKTELFINRMEENEKRKRLY